MQIEARGFIKDPKTGEEREVKVLGGLHGAVDTALAKAAIRALFTEAGKHNCIPVRIEGLTATTETEWRPDHFPDLLNEF